MTTLRRNAVWNILGVVIPTLVGLWSMPILVHHLGAVRFGVLSLCWTLVGFLGVMDMGVGRALTQALASHAQKDVPVAESAGLAIYGVFSVLVLGLLWGGGLLLNSRWFAGYMFSADQDLLPEVASGLVWLGASIPIAMVAAAFIGILEGKQRFAVVNSIRICVGAATFLAPLGVSYYSADLASVIGSLFAARLLALLLYAGFACTVIPELLRPSAPSRADVAGVFRFSGWLSVSNIVGPILVYIDRLLISRLLGPVALTHYSVPVDIMTRLTAMPLAIMNASFPALAKEYSSKSGLIGQMLNEATVSLLLFWLPPLLIGSLFANELLSFWIGREIAGFSTPIVHWFAIGVFINGCALLPYTLLQSEGRSDITAVFHLIELPIHIAILVIGISGFGIAGAAMAWVVRVGLDAFLLYRSAWQRHATARLGLRRAALLVVGGTMILSIAPWTESLSGKILISITVCVAAAIPIVQKIFGAWFENRQV